MYFEWHRYPSAHKPTLHICASEGLYGWCIMTSHVHLIIGTKENPLQNIMRDLKRHTAEELHKSLRNNYGESRREWILWMMERAAKKNNNAARQARKSNPPDFP